LKPAKGTDIICGSLLAIPARNRSIRVNAR
jgi:hypothetical protein